MSEDKMLSNEPSDTDQFKDAVAVVTGGASGMGQAIAQRLAGLGAKVVIADIEEPAIVETVVGINDAGGQALGVTTDVSNLESMENLREVTEREFGPTDFLFLNAGVGGGGPLHETDMKEWHWILGVNLYGVIHGISVFLPGMVERDRGHVVNTASVAGLNSYPNMGPYNVSKHAVVTLSETLYHELQELNSNLGVSVLCPGFVRTNIYRSERNRPEELQDPIIPDDDEPDMSEAVAAIYDMALESDAVAAMVEDAIRTKKFYILTDAVFDKAVALRHRNIERQENPTLRGQLWEEHLGMASDPAGD